MRKINIALIGAGRMGISQAKAFGNVCKIYNDGIEPVMYMVADVAKEAAENFVQRFGFQKAVTDWHETLKDPNVDLVVVTTPNDSHVEICLAALEAGKHILCEKPLGLSSAECKQVVEAAKKKHMVNAVGFNYIQNPMLQYANKLLKSGEFGKTLSFRGVFDMDFCADPESPHTWRQSSAIAGALGDTGSHVLGIAEYLVGDISEVCGVGDIIYTDRPDPAAPGRRLPVENDDQFHMLFRFENGGTGSIITSRVAPGRKIGLGFEIQCEKGTIYFSEERLNELQVYRHTDRLEDQGFKLIRCNAEHGDYRFFTGTAGVGITYIDLVTIQAHGILKAIAENRPFNPDFESGWKIAAAMDAALKSDKEKRWVALREFV